MMRFKKWPNATPFEVTERKRAAVLVSQRRKREALPLLAPLIAETQPSVDVVMEMRATLWVTHEQKTRDRRAADWREARRRLERVGDTQPLVRSLWNEAPYPADPGYLLDFLLQIERGKINPTSPPWRYTEVEQAEMQSRFAAFLERTASRKSAAASQPEPAPVASHFPIRVRPNGLLTSGDHD
jgi:hypothetical protein